MGSVPIDPSLISGAIPYNSPLTASNSKIGEAPIDPFTGKRQKHLRYVPMQFTFGAATAFQVQLNNISPHVPFTQLASMYVDATQSKHDVTILFPDSGWQTRVAFGDTAMLNPLTAQDQPNFYVILDSSGETSATDVVNVFAIDTYIPPSQSSIFERTVAYGYSSMFELQPTFTQSQAFAVSTAGEESFGPYTIIDNTQWFITAMQINVIAEANADTIFTIELKDSGETFMFFSFVATEELTEYEIVSLSGLNYISKGNGPLTAQLFGTTANFTNFIINFNMMGGVLVT